MICNIDNQEVSKILAVDIYEASATGLTLQKYLARQSPYFNAIDSALFVNMLPNDLKVKSYQKRTKSGIYFLNKLQFKLLGKNNNLLDVLLSSSLKPLVLSLISSDQNNYIIGNTEEPLRMTFAELMPTSELSFGGYDVQIESKSIAPIIYTGGVGAAPDGDHIYPIGQLQADMAQTDDTKVDFVKNKNRTVPILVTSNIPKSYNDSIGIVKDTIALTLTADLQDNFSMNLVVPGAHTLTAEVTPDLTLHAPDGNTLEENEMALIFREGNTFYFLK